MSITRTTGVGHQRLSLHVDLVVVAEPRLLHQYDANVRVASTDGLLRCASAVAIVGDGMLSGGGNGGSPEASDGGSSPCSSTSGASSSMSGAGV